MSGECLIVFLLVGLVLGCISGLLDRDEEADLFSHLVMGGAGAIVAGGRLIPKIELGITLGNGMAGAVVNSIIGAVVFLSILRLAKLV